MNDTESTTLNPKPTDKAPAPPPPHPDAVPTMHNEAGTSAAADADAAAPLPNLPGYELLEVLGRGGMGVVYKARQISLNRLVALKMILSGAHAGRHEVARFRTEAEAVARLHHPNIVQVYEVGADQDRPFMALELVDSNLSRKIAGVSVPPEQAAQWMEALARAVHYAHQHGIIHRDLKPANILLSRDGTVKISDFGTAKFIENSAHGPTMTGAVFGTPCYMSPEQAEGRTRQIGPLADVYGLGAILYELLTGRPPFRGETPQHTIELVRLQEPVPPSSLQPATPPDLETICLRCLSKEPHQRYATAEALADDLRAFLAGEPIRSRPARPWERLARWARRRPAEAALLGTGIMAFVGLIVGIVWFNALAMAALAGLSLLLGSWWYSARLKGALDEVTRQQALTQRNVERLHLLLDLTRRLMRTAKPDELLRLLTETAVRLTSAEFATLYLVDHEHGELWSKTMVERGVGEIRLPLGVGIAGTVAVSGNPINIPDAYADPRFNQAVDKRSGHKTRNLLTVPVTAQDGTVLGVFQVMNKVEGAFGMEDIEMLSSLAASASITLAQGAAAFSAPALGPAIAPSISAK
jgi:putative methionine-R-sulfoxide reductase with GAF domain